MTTRTLLPFQPDAMKPAQLAAVSYLARYSGHTHALYAYQLRRWFSWCQTNGLDPLVGIQRAHVELYIRHLGESGLRVSSVNTMMHGVRGFFRFAHIDGLTTADPAVYARLPKIHSDESRTQGLDRLELIRFLRWSKVTDTPLLVLALPFVVVLVVPLLADLSPAQQFPDRRAARVAQPDAQTPPVRTPRSWPSWLRRTTQAATETMSTKEAGAFFLTQVCRTNRASTKVSNALPIRADGRFNGVDMKGGRLQRVRRALAVASDMFYLSGPQPSSPAQCLAGRRCRQGGPLH